MIFLILVHAHLFDVSQLLYLCVAFLNGIDDVCLFCEVSGDSFFDFIDSAFVCGGKRCDRVNLGMMRANNGTLLADWFVALFTEELEQTVMQSTVFII